MVEGKIARYRFPSLSTDSAAFSRYAGELLLEGKNPYAFSMHPALNAAPIGGFHRTALATGGLQDDFPYPSLHFVLDLPATMLDLPYESTAAILLLLFAGVLCAALDTERALVFALALHLPWTLVPLLANGVTDLPWALALAAAVLTKGPARAAWAGLAAAQKHPGALGLLLLAARESRRDARRGAEFLVGALLVALLPQVPFLIADPGAWFYSVTRIVVGPLVALGPGVGILARSEGVEIEQLLSLASTGIFLGGILLELRGGLGRFAFLVPIAAFFLRPRYLFTYFLFWLIPFVADLLLKEGDEGKVEDVAARSASA